MTREEAKEYVKSGLESYLQGKGIDTKKTFRCLNPEHADSRPSMSYDQRRRKVHCFSCGADYDTFSVIGIDYGVSGSEMFLKAYEFFGLTVENGSNSFKSAGVSSPKSVTFPGKSNAAQEIAHSAEQYCKKCSAMVHLTDYPSNRGLCEEVVSRFGLGFDPEFDAGGGNVWQALIIPTGNGSYVARNTDNNADKHSRYRKNGRVQIFNAQALQTAEKPIFVVEGEIDALSVISVGGEAVALGSTANISNFLNLLKSEKPVQPLILALDNDENGMRATDKLIEGLEGLILAFHEFNAYNDSKDASEALQCNLERFKANVAKAENIEQELAKEKRVEYQKTSAGAHIGFFLKRINESVNTPVISTGFLALDSILDGGLYEGLYTVGAISSLGKTTLITQITDQIAQNWTDVLIFSLEMARSELMAKSISRHTIMEILKNGGDMNLAKTTRGITDGKRYAYYSQAEGALIGEAVKAYGAYADRLFILEGMGDIGAAQVREAVQRHFSFTGRRPVAVVDYLQILAPHSERATDKQSIDKAVLELKRISRDFKIPVIAISSFNRQSYNEAVTMTAFKESGAVEYSSDVLIGLQLAGAGTSGFDPTVEKKKDPREVELVVLKNRNGATGDTVEFEYYPRFNYFREVSLL